jgi:hypothetical protein
MPLRLRLEPTVKPERVKPEELESLTVELSVTNENDETIDLQLPSSTLLVDGQRSLSWNIAIANGAREARESALPPGDSITVARVMGSGLVKDPGDHEVVIEVRGVRSPPVHVVVEHS